MRRYETIFIADPDIQENARQTLFDKFKNLLDLQGGLLVDFDDWGNRKLAYDIKKKPRGHYACMTYGGTGELVRELERNLRLDDQIMKFMTILLEKDVAPETLETEIADRTARETADAESARKAAAAEDDTANAPAPTEGATETPETAEAAPQQEEK